MCCVIRIGARSIVAPISRDQMSSAPAARRSRNRSAAPAAETVQTAAEWNAGAVGLRRPARLWRGRGARRPARPWRANERPRRPRMRILSISSRWNAADVVGVGRGFGLRNIVGGAERQRPQADFGAPARQRRGHDHDEIALLLEQERQRRNAVKLRHVDVENDDVGIALLRSARPPRGRCASDAATIMSGSAPIQRVNRRRATIASSTTMTRMGRSTTVAGLAAAKRRYSCTRTFGTQLLHSDIRRSRLAERCAFRSVRLPGTWPRQCPCRTAS